MNLPSFPSEDAVCGDVSTHHFRTATTFLVVRPVVPLALPETVFNYHATRADVQLRPGKSLETKHLPIFATFFLRCCAAPSGKCKGGVWLRISGCLGAAAGGLPVEASVHRVADRRGRRAENSFARDVIHEGNHGAVLRDSRGGRKHVLARESGGFATRNALVEHPRQGNSRSGGNDAERKESARAQESRQEGGGSDSGLEIAVGANNTPRQQQRREQQHHFFFLRAHAGDPSQNPAREPDGLFHELPCGRRILRHGDTDHPRSSGLVLPVIVAFSESSGGGERPISGERFAAAIRSECFPP
ncbi:hypothetical protein THAOC_31160 [Thalassiosira oceanica]|uniref:Uncharacterized protein n=1 Tax=Thalassiosira oceanica TaxID=159749 RepID=K0R8P6_THAOC|nr:hypothetical protein THAOC_31160 [Thalassiosira oceanica]|eukprot:EJK49918.1 hypothetical protein THAOC_31160 [Thalassiosira oceanica]